MKPLDPPSLEAHLEEEIDFTGVVDFLLEARWLIALFALSCLLLGVAYAFLATPVYRSDILIQVEEPDNSSKGILGDVSSLFAIKTGAATEIQILSSRLVVSRAVDALHLDLTATPRYFPLVGHIIAGWGGGLSTPGIFGKGGFAWGRERIAVTAFDVPKKFHSKPFDLEFLGNRHYKLTSPAGDSEFEGTIGVAQTFRLPEGPVTLNVSSIDANPGTRFVLTGYSREDTIEKLQKKLNISEKTLESDVISASLECNDADVCSAIMHAIGQAYVAQNIERKTADAQKSLAFLNEQLPEFKAQLERAEESYTRFRDQHGTIDLSTEGQQMLQESADSQEKLLALQMQKQDMLTRFSPENPDVLSLDKQIGALNDSLAQIQGGIRHFPDLEQQVVGLMRDVQVSTELYTSLLNTSEQLRIVEAGRTGTVRLVDDATAPDAPVKPQRLLVIGLALVIGIVLGVITAIVRARMFGGVLDPEHIEQLTGLDVMSTIPYSEAQDELVREVSKGDSVALLATSYPRDPTIESLRSLRTAMQFSMLTAHNNIVMLTGATPGVGKSFLAANFADVLAAGGKRILLIDADFYKGHLHKYFDSSRDVGFSELLAGTADGAAVTRRGVGSGFDFIPTGALPGNPSELLLSQAFPIELEKLAKRYDFVIVDTPPVLSVSDAQVVGAHAGAVFVVARYKLTKIGELHEAIKRFGRAGVKVNGVLFNGLKLKKSRYGYGSPYGRFRYTQESYYDYHRGT